MTSTRVLLRQWLYFTSVLTLVSFVFTFTNQTHSSILPNTSLHSSTSTSTSITSTTTVPYYDCSLLYSRSAPQIHTLSTLCETATHCPSQSSFNYPQVRFCLPAYVLGAGASFEGAAPRYESALSKAIVSVVFAVWVAILFYALSRTADQYFAVSLAKLVDLLKISPEIAGVTFLSLGNGAPDISAIFAAILMSEGGGEAAAQQQSDWSSVSWSDSNFSLALGDVLGGGMFVTTVVVGVVCSLSRVVLVPQMFLRDASVYLLSNLLILAVLLDGKISWYEALTLCLAYVVYVISVFFTDRYLRIQYHKNRLYYDPQAAIPMDAPQYEVQTVSLQQLDEVQHEQSNQDMLQQTSHIHSHNSKSQGTSESTPLALTPNSESYHTITSGSKKKLRCACGDELSEDDELTKATHSIHFEELSKARVALYHSSSSTWATRHTSTSLADSFFTSLRRAIRFISRIFAFIPNGVLALTVPIIGGDCDDPFTCATDPPPLFWFEFGGANTCVHIWTWWHRAVIILSPIITPLLFLESLNYTDVSVNIPSLTSSSRSFPFWSIVLVVGATISLLLLIMGVARHGPPEPTMPLIFWSFLASLAWLNLTAREIISLVTLLGSMFNVSRALLGLTILTWGNSLGDMVANVSTAKDGEPRMALAACYAGPTFNMLFSLGLASLIRCYREYPHPYYVYFDRDTKIASAFIISTLIITLVSVYMRHFITSNKLSIVLWTLYGAFFCLALYSELYL